VVGRVDVKRGSYAVDITLEGFVKVALDVAKVSSEPFQPISAEVSRSVLVN
jgi:hypothetical protein